jgi:hypothetical protein
VLLFAVNTDVLQVLCSASQRLIVIHATRCEEFNANTVSARFYVL